MTDIIDVVAGYAPEPTNPEWSTARQEAALRDILDAPRRSVPAVEIPLQLAIPPRRRNRRRATGLAASAAALAAAASVIVAITLHGAQRGPVLAAGVPWNPPAGLSDKAPIDSGKYGYEIVHSSQYDANGVRMRGEGAAGSERTYVSPDGTVFAIDLTHPPQCSTHGPGPAASFDTPSKAFFARLPTDVAALERYFRTHVEGSSSRDEAVFLAVGDVLRNADALASPKLKAAMLAMLSRTGGVVLHEGVPDVLGRPTIRADFVNQAIRPGEVQSLFFDPRTFAVVEQGEFSNGQPSTYSGPSPAYTAHAGAGVDPDQLSRPWYVEVVSHIAVVDALPACPR